MTVGEAERLYAAAMADYAQGRYAPAAKLLLGLILVDATQARFFKGMAACMQLMGRYREAAMGYASAIALQPEDDTLLFYLAQCLAGAGGWPEAGEAAQTFLDRTAAASGAHAGLRGKALALVRLAETKRKDMEP